MYIHVYIKCTSAFYVYALYDVTCDTKRMSQWKVKRTISFVRFYDFIGTRYILFWLVRGVGGVHY